MLWSLASTTKPVWRRWVPPLVESSAVVNRRRRYLTFVLAAVLTLPSAASAQQVRVIISGGFSAAYRELLPEFEASTRIAVATATGGSVGTGPNTIGSQLRRGVPADVVILAREGLGELIAEGR